MVGEDGLDRAAEWGRKNPGLDRGRPPRENRAVTFPTLAARRACVLLGAALFVGVFTSSEGRAKGAVASANPSPVRSIDELRRATGPEKYGALRAVWRQWDQTDPTEIEEAIFQVEQDKSLSPPIRTYAAIVAAYARRRRGDLDGARAKIHATGLIDRWLVLGPFDNEGKEGLDRTLQAEREQGEPIDLMRPYQGKERQVRWRASPDVYGFGWIDLGDLVRPRENVCVLATTFVRSKQGESRPASLWAGASGAFKLFWNGTEVLTDLAYRSLDADRFGVSVTLAKGWN